METKSSAVLLGLAVIMTGAAEPKLLAGNWGGPGANLTFDAQGGKLQQDCASASFGPIRIDAKGRFKTSGHFETYGPGPQSADKSSATSATFEGLVRGETLQLTIRPTGGAAQTLTLQQGRRMKIIRCY